MYKRVIIRKDLLYPELSYEIIGVAFDVHNEVGGGHHEKYYQRALSEAFSKKDLKFVEQLSFPIKYGHKIIGRRILDFLVQDKIIVEIKAGDRFSKTHIDQVLGYLKISGLKLAILINFGRDGVMFRRLVNFS